MGSLAFYIPAAVAIAATFMVVTSGNAIHALLYLVVSLLAAAVVLLVFGAPFAAAMEVIIYAGAIMVLFVFVVMILGRGPHQKRTGPPAAAWIGPGILAAVLAAELAWLEAAGGATVGAAQVAPAAVGASLMGPYLLGVELASVLLLVGLVGAFHLGYRLGVKESPGQTPDKAQNDGGGP
jgi:NADH-quinone oxidoreductase subunit J